MSRSSPTEWNPPRGDADLSRDTVSLTRLLTALGHELALGTHTHIVSLSRLKAPVHH